MKGAALTSHHSVRLGGGGLGVGCRGSSAELKEDMRVALRRDGMLVQYETYVNAYAHVDAK